MSILRDTARPPHEAVGVSRAEKMQPLIYAAFGALISGSSSARSKVKLNHYEAFAPVAASPPDCARHSSRVSFSEFKL